jgi:hypothetical protein
MYKRFIVLLGVFLASHAPAAAQAPLPQILLAQEHGAPIMTILRTVSPPLLTASLLLYQDPGKSPVYFSHLFAGAYERDHMEFLSPMEDVKTLFFTQSSLPLVQLWSGRLQLDAFQNTLHIQNMQLGPLNMLDFHHPRQSYSGGPRSVHFTGLSVSFHFGRGARAGRPTQPWRSLSRIVATVLN